MFNPAEGYPAVVPYHRYADPAGAIHWLERVVGAKENVRLTLPDGRIGHAELAVGDAVIAIGLSALGERSIPDPPSRAELLAMTLVFVEDVDRAFEIALEVGSAVVEAPVEQPWGLRQAIVADLEGFVWELSQHVRDVDAADWGATASTP